MYDLEHITKLLLNIEESILNIIMSQTNRIPRNIYSIEIALRMINIDNSFKTDIVNNYNEKFQIYPADIDILNLIVKYMELSGKIVYQKNQCYLGVKEVNYNPKNDVETLETDYYIARYLKPHNHYKSSEYKKALSIFINILVPFSVKHCLKIYDKL